MSRVVQSGNSVSGMTIQELKRALGLEFVVDFDTRPKGGGKSRGGNGQMTGMIILLIILLTILLIILMIILLIILLNILKIILPTILLILTKLLICPNISTNT